MKPSLRPAPRRISGFTLIELLTVIAIIGILAAILIPTVGAVREKARQTQCASDLRQWGGAIMLFAADNKSKYAVRYGSDYWCQVSTSATNTVYSRYFGNTRGVIPNTCVSQGDTVKNGVWSSAHDSHYMMTRPSTDIGGAPIVTTHEFAITKIRTPSQFVLMVERAFTTDLDPVIGGSLDDTILTNGNARANAQGFLRHSAKMNTLWADGHVSRTAFNASSSDGWNQQGDGVNYNFRRWLALNN